MNKIICQLVGCENQCYSDKRTGRLHDYCCWTHANLDQAITVGDSNDINHEIQNQNLDFAAKLNILAYEDQLELALAISQIEEEESNKTSKNKVKTNTNRSTMFNNVVTTANSSSSSNISFDNKNLSQSNITHNGYDNSSSHKRKSTNNEKIVELSDPDTDMELLRAIELSLQNQNLPKPPQQSLHHHNTTSPHDIEYDMAMAKSLQEQEQLDLENEMVSKLANIKQVWTCETCSRENIDLNDTNSCTFCGADRSIEWSCSQCLFDNAKTEDQCSMCGLYNPYYIPPPIGKNDNTANAMQNSSPSTTSTQPSTNVRTTCGIPGCSRVSTYYGFCTKNHHELAIEKRLLAPSSPHIESIFVGDTGDFTAHLLMNTHRKYNMINEQFLKSWPTKHAPCVQRIYFIGVSPLIFHRFNIASKTIGNVKKLFHGTTQSPNCHFGVTPTVNPCSDKICRVCSICRESFSMSKVGSNTGGSLYGKGLYFSPLSTKSHGYNFGSAKFQNCEFRSMFLCNVAVGKTYESKAGSMPGGKCPPVGYNSITGLAGNKWVQTERVISLPCCWT
eukprot:gene2920-5734_t